MPLDLWSTDLGAACEVERVNDPQHLLEDMAHGISLTGGRHFSRLKAQGHTTSPLHYPLHPSAARVRASAKLRPVVVG